MCAATKQCEQLSLWYYTENSHLHVSITVHAAISTEKSEQQVAPLAVPVNICVKTHFSSEI
jgi:hypothetical protein